MAVIDEIIARLERDGGLPPSGNHRTHRNASGDYVCPSCGYSGPMSDFESESDDDSGKWRTDEEAASTDGGDPDNTAGDESLLDMNNKKSRQELLAESLIQAANKAAHTKYTAEQIQQMNARGKKVAQRQPQNAVDLLTEAMAKLRGESPR